MGEPEHGDRRPLIRPSFIIYGEGWDPAECTQRIGIQPSATRVKGERPPGTRVPFQDTHWKVTIERRDHYIDGPVSELLAQVWSRRHSILAFLDRPAANTHVHCAVSLFGEPAGYSLSAQAVKRIAALQAEFSLDIVDYAD